jgi:hypothetical protein
VSATSPSSHRVPTYSAGSALASKRSEDPFFEYPLLEQVLPLDPDKPPTILHERLFASALLKNDLVSGLVVEVFGFSVEFERQLLFLPGEVQAMASHPGPYTELELRRLDT